jgi:hypothetical protein
MLLAATDPTAADPHSTCEVLFPDDIPVGTVLEPQGYAEPTEKLSYVKPDMFFSMPLSTHDGVLTVDEKPVMSKDGLTVHAKKYLNGPVG